MEGTDTHRGGSDTRYIHCVHAYHELPAHAPARCHKNTAKNVLYLPSTDDPSVENKSAIINPCGLVAWSYFNDSLEVE